MQLSLLFILYIFKSQKPYGIMFYKNKHIFSANQGGSQRPQYLSLLHVRLPPGFTPNASVLKPKQVHSAVYDNGEYIFLLNVLLF